MNLKNFIDEIKNQYVGFVFLKEYTTKKDGLKSDCLINAGYNYGNAKARDIKLIDGNLINFVPKDSYTEQDWNIALSEVRTSLEKPNENRSEGQKEAYIKLNESGSILYCPNTNSILINGLLVRKNEKPYSEHNTIIKSTMKKVNSSAKTLAKKQISYQLRTGQIRHYILSEEQIKSITINGKTLEIGL